MDAVLEVTGLDNRGEDATGIVIRGQAEPVRRPVISAFIWGGKVRPTPTLPFGRWKQTAA